MNHQRRTHVDSPSIDPQGRITARTWDPTILRLHIPWWDALNDAEKLAELRALDGSLATQEVKTTNIALDGLLEHIPEALDPTGAATATTSHLALGTSTDEPQPGNEQLGNEVYRTIVGDAESDGTDLLTSTYLSQIEGNGFTITEVGLAGGPDEDDRLLTHALFATGDEIEKNSNMVVVIDYIIDFGRPA